LPAADGARAATRVAVAEIGMRIPQDADFSAMVATAVAFAGEREQRERVYTLRLPRSGRIVLTSVVGYAVMDLYDRLLLVLAAALERWDVIDTHAIRALDIAAALGSPVWTARVRADWADALLGRARPGDAGRAAEL